MPTINEVWEQAVQVNANLAQLHNDITALRNRADETNARLGDIEQVTADGFASLAQGLVALQSRADIANVLLDTLVKQGSTVICNLEKLSDLTCKLLQESVKQTAFEARTAAGIEGLVHMTATSQPEAGLAWKRQQELQAKMDECCPEKPPAPPCTYQPCPAPDLPKVEYPKPYQGFEPREHGSRGSGARDPR